MIIDRYTKAVFTLIAISLFVISLNPWIVPTKAYADFGSTDTKILRHGLDKIANAVDLIDCSR